MKKFLFVFLLMIPSIAFAHSGGTDANGGHYDRSTGEYHYHHGYEAHQHPDGICPYEDTELNNESYEYEDTNANYDYDYWYGFGFGDGHYFGAVDGYFDAIRNTSSYSVPLPDIEEYDDYYPGYIEGTNAGYDYGYTAAYSYYLENPSDTYPYFNYYPLFPYTNEYISGYEDGFEEGLDMGTFDREEGYEEGQNLFEDEIASFCDFSTLDGSGFYHGYIDGYFDGYFNDFSEEHRYDHLEIISDSNINNDINDNISSEINVKDKEYYENLFIRSFPLLFIILFLYFAFIKK